VTSVDPNSDAGNEVGGGAVAVEDEDPATRQTPLVVDDPLLEQATGDRARITTEGGVLDDGGDPLAVRSTDRDVVRVALPHENPLEDWGRGRGARRWVPVRRTLLVH